jgi:predicted MFS family arabinose efflux permease
VAGATLINRMGAMVFPFLVLYFHRSLRLDLGLATSIAACWGVGSFVAGPLGGWAADRVDPVRLMVISMAGAGTVMLGFPFVGDARTLMVATFGLALLADLSRPSTMTALARLGGPEHGRNAFALNYLAINLGMSIGPLLGGILAERDYRWLFWVDGSTSLLAAVLLWASGAACLPQTKSTDSTDWNIGSAAFRLYLWTSITFWVFMTFFTAGPVFAVEQLHLREHDCGYIWLVNTLLIVFTSLWINRLTEGIRLAGLLSISALCMVACYLTLWLWPSVFGLIGATLFLTVGEMLLFSNANAYVAKVVPGHKMGRAMGVNAVCASVSLTLSAPTVGYFFTRHSPADLWLAMAAVALVGACGFWLLPTPGESAGHVPESPT